MATATAVERCDVGAAERGTETGWFGGSIGEQRGQVGV
jgi:hypothetical protein